MQGQSKMQNQGIESGKTYKPFEIMCITNRSEGITLFIILLERELDRLYYTKRM